MSENTEEIREIYQDYIEVLEKISDLDEYFDQLETELDIESFSDWTLVDKTSDYALFRNSRGEHRIVSAKQINNAFKHEDY